MANRLKEDEKNERIIRNLLKLPENRRCINCNSLGPQYVCTNFSTFICTACSGIHREFTHRVKSVSMAKFTPQEVSALQGGGNGSARLIYLKDWDAQRNSLPDGSNVERLRDFIKHVYVDRRFTGERNSEKPLTSKMEETADFDKNRRIDSYQGGSRSPPYENRGDRPGPGGRSPGYNQEVQRNNGDNKRSPGHADVVNDWRREDRFGNGRRSEDRSSNGGSKPGGRSPDSQGSDMSSPPMVRPVREILGENVSPLRVIEPPKATVGKIGGPPHTQRTASSSSLASSDGNPSEVKAEISFIDFDSVPEPPVTATVQQTKAVSDASAVQLGAPSSDNWANFDSGSQVKVNTAASNSLESSLLDLSVPAPISGSSSFVGISSFQSSALPFGVTAPPASVGPTPQLTNTSGSLFASAPTGGQWPNMMPQPVNPAISGLSSSMPQNPLVVPNTHGPSGVSVGQAPAKPSMDTSFGFGSELPSGTKSGGRKELPADLFAMNYSYMPPSAPGWYSGSAYGAGVPMQYNMPMAVPNMQAVPNMLQVSRSTNPFDLGNEPSSAQASTFPSMTSLHGALPKAPSPLMPSQSPSYASSIPPNSYLGQQIGVSIAPSPPGQSGFGFEENAFTSLYPNHRSGGIHTAHSATSAFPPTGGNPFG